MALPKSVKITSVSSHKFIFFSFIIFIFVSKNKIKRFLTNPCLIRKAGSLSSPRFGPTIPRLRVFRHSGTSFSDFYSIFTSEVQIWTAIDGSQISLVHTFLGLTYANSAPSFVATLYPIGPKKATRFRLTKHPLIEIHRASATMTVEEAPSNYDGLISQSEASAQQPTDLAPPRFRPLSVATTVSAIGPKTANTAPTRSSKTLTAQTKVAIPRQRVAAAPRYNRRVPRACASCRQRKTKCSGDTPVCRQCRELRATCSYPDGWRERTKKYVYL